MRMRKPPACFMPFHFVAGLDSLIPDDSERENPYLVPYRSFVPARYGCFPGRSPGQVPPGLLPRVPV